MGREITKVQARPTALVEQCGNCGRPIGKLETPHLWQSNVVCPECHGRLTRQATAHLVVPNASSVVPLPAPVFHPSPAPTPMPMQPIIIQSPAPTVNVFNQNTQTVNMRVQRRGCLGTIFRMIFLLVVIVVITIAICVVWTVFSVHAR